MTIRVALRHVTEYRYTPATQLGAQTIRLRPAPHTRQRVLNYALGITPQGHFINWQQDAYANHLARVVFPEPVSHFRIAVDLVTDMAVFNPFDFFLEPDAETFPFAYAPQDAADLQPYLSVDAATPRLADWLSAVPSEEAPTVAFLVELNQRVNRDIDYVVRMEPGVQTPEETLALGQGSCRDSAWLLAQILRHMGLASRFVSGYLIQLKPDVPSLDGPSGAEEDFTDLHAWVEVFLPGAGWVGLDPTSGLFAGEGHVPLAAAPTPAGAAPISGSLEPAETEFSFSMDVSRVLETPRVTKPYTDEVWSRIDSAGQELQSRLNAMDVRLTIGGEPTFVGIDHPDEPEWNTAAAGANKEARARDLIHRLKARFAPSGVLQFGQGKWYPGEQLPRWAYALYWRTDGEPLGSSGTEGAAETAVALSAGEHDVRFGRAMAARLGLSGTAVVPAYEDPWPVLESERKLPENLGAADNRLDDPMARERLARVIERGLERPVAAVLPVQRWNAPAAASRWQTEIWRTRAGRLFLMPGDSAAGYRLPLPSLPYIAPVDYPHVVAQDPFDQRDKLPPASEIHAAQQRFTQARAEPERSESRQTLVEQTLAADGVRTALVFEVRGDAVHVFLPPVAQLEGFVELVEAAQGSAEALGVALVLEGYPPPPDPRLNVIKVTPDPGVIEVNVQPAGSWRELTSNVTALYEEARLARLDTQKFMIDGRHTGTGGGNHIVLGGATAADSPFLRRPDLLRSLVGFWQQHPSLSYLFSGLFIGPISQAPRADEARMDVLYELELAFAQVDRAGEQPAPWLVDRIFRNLLADVTGNTHRTEICIDKLYAPDSATGRLGLVEFRAFEMPPHAQMSLAQSLLMFALVATFWRTPHRAPLVRWQTRLHDQFMLPHFVWNDFRNVIESLRRAGSPLEADWFWPHFEFRFPEYGAIHYDEIELELRQALEPWHVLGEEGAVGGTVRYVDSSLERLQIKVSGFNAQRYSVGCSNVRVPLQATDVPGEYVAGIRFRAWQPAASLHPTISTNVPLTIGIYDHHAGSYVAACTYHASHPGGRNYETLPVNSFEAESRRLARFEPFGSDTANEAPEAAPTSEFPGTLDLRWV